MSSYNAPIAKPIAVNAAATGGAATKVFSTNSSARIGYSICNLSTSKSYYMECPLGATAPTAAEVIATPTGIIQPDQTITNGARADTDIYLAAATVLAHTAQELR